MQKAGVMWAGLAAALLPARAAPVGPKHV